MCYLSSTECSLLHVSRVRGNRPFSLSVPTCLISVPIFTYKSFIFFMSDVSFVLSVTVTSVFVTVPMLTAKNAQLYLSTNLDNILFSNVSWH